MVEEKFDAVGLARFCMQKLGVASFFLWVLGFLVCGFSEAKRAPKLSVGGFEGTDRER